jgi:hypothetical protein
MLELELWMDETGADPHRITTSIANLSHRVFNSVSC